jgi:CDP-glycerol glycerophosphotransferase
LQKLSDKLGLAARVTFTGFLHNPLPFVANASALVCTSDIEGQPINVLEALVLGTPVIATNIEGPRGLLEDGCGMLVDPSVDAFVEAMVSLARDGPPTNLKHFDATRYVEEALAEFYALLRPADQASPATPAYIS